MRRHFETILVTGGCGFIGSNLIRYLFEKSGYEGRIVNLDALTYAGNRENLGDVEARWGGSGPEARYVFIHGDIRDEARLRALFRDYEPEAVIHLAAESHVDRSLLGPEAFVSTNVMGTFRLLEAAREAWKGRRDVLFHQVSTDEVYGSLGDRGRFTEASPYEPHSPYSASKAGADHLVMAYFHSYGLPVTLSNCSNNYGPYQFPEKLIPLLILNMIEGKVLPIYGEGRNVRDWLHVEDHCAALWAIVQGGEAGRRYNIGGGCEKANIDILYRLIEIVAQERGEGEGRYRSLVRFVEDRAGHDQRYAIDSGRIEAELGWRPTHGFDQGLQTTVEWYLAHRDWCFRVRRGT